MATATIILRGDDDKIAALLHDAISSGLLVEYTARVGARETVIPRKAKAKKRARKSTVQPAG